MDLGHILFSFNLSFLWKSILSFLRLELSSINLRAPKPTTKLNIKQACKWLAKRQLYCDRHWHMLCTNAMFIYYTHNVHYEPFCCSDLTFMAWLIMMWYISWGFLFFAFIFSSISLYWFAWIDAFAMDVRVNGREYNEDN